jgi:hypothetical protein
MGEKSGGEEYGPAHENGVPILFGLISQGQKSLSAHGPPRDVFIKIARGSRSRVTHVFPSKIAEPVPLCNPKNASRTYEILKARQ